MRIISKSEEETRAEAHRIAKAAQGGDIFMLSGDLGSGKTTFVKGFAEALGISSPITSPTFVILKTYPVADVPKVKHLVHIDAYRLQGSEDFEAIGGAELLSDPDTIGLIEWPKVVIPLLPNHKLVNFKYLSDHEREIEYDFLPTN